MRLTRVCEGQTVPQCEPNCQTGKVRAFDNNNIRCLLPLNSDSGSEEE